MAQENYTEQEYANAIRELRFANDVPQAIDKCLEAISNSPQNNFFHKILGDMYLQIGEYKKASTEYLTQLSCLNSRPRQFKSFVKSFRHFEEKAPGNVLDEFYLNINNLLKRGAYGIEMSEDLTALLGIRFKPDAEQKAFLSQTDDDTNLNSVRQYITEKLEAKDISTVKAVISYRLNAKNRIKSPKTESYIITLAEHNGMYHEALALISGNRNFTKSPTGKHTLLRICRKSNDYSLVKELLRPDGRFIENSNFNVLYELVYYFEHENNDVLLKQTLNRIKGASAHSIPIARTLYNFYLRFGMFEEANQASSHIRELTEHKANSRVESEIETEQEFVSFFMELLDKREHTVKMTSLLDLLKGFSHEVGQPITNIRYSVQLYQMKLRYGGGQGNIDDLLKLILSQTKRIGDLLKRFTPIVSGKNKDEQFSVVDRINGVFLNLRLTMDERSMRHKVYGNRAIKVKGDAIRFDQVFYNLIQNSVHAMAGYKSKGFIKVKVGEAVERSEVYISFSDNGPGMPEKIADKIFDPFNTTNETTSTIGGEGLGLYIIWNIIRMFNGRIELNREYKDGVKFNIVINKGEENDEQSADNRR